MEGESPALTIFAKKSTKFDWVLNTPLNVLQNWKVYQLIDLSEVVRACNTFITFLTAHEKLSFPLRISSVDVTKSAGNSLRFRKCYCKVLVLQSKICR